MRPGVRELLRCAASTTSTAAARLGALETADRDAADATLAEESRASAAKAVLVKNVDSLVIVVVAAGRCAALLLGGFAAVVAPQATRIAHSLVLLAPPHAADRKPADARRSLVRD